MENRTGIVQQPNAIEDWRQIDEPTSDLYRLTGTSRSKKLRNPEEYRGSADLHWDGAGAAGLRSRTAPALRGKGSNSGNAGRYKWDWFATYTVNMQAKPGGGHSSIKRVWTCDQYGNEEDNGNCLQIELLCEKGHTFGVFLSPHQNTA